jgi:hypothetical protein
MSATSNYPRIFNEVHNTLLKSFEERKDGFSAISPNSKINKLYCTKHYTDIKSIAFYLSSDLPAMKDGEKALKKVAGREVKCYMDEDLGQLQVQCMIKDRIAISTKIKENEFEKRFPYVVELISRHLVGETKL